MGITFWIVKKRYLNIYCRLSKNGFPRAEISTKTHVDEKKWGGTYMLMRGRTQEAVSVNKKLERFKRNIEDIIIKLEDDGHPMITPQLIKSIYDKNTGKINIDNEELQIYSVLKNTIDYIERLGYVEPNTINGYRSTLSMFESFLKDRLSIKMPINSFLNEHTKMFVERLRNNGNKLSTIRVYIARLSAIYSSIEDTGFGISTTNPFSLKIKKTSSDVVDEDIKMWFSFEEQEKIENTDFEPKIKYASKILLFQIYTGLAYADVVRFDPDTHITIDIDKSRWIRIKRKKLKKHTRFSDIPVNDKIDDLVEFFKDNRGRRSFIQIEYVTYTNHLKQISQKLGMDKIKSHMARHTFGVRKLEEGLSMESVSHMMGHSSISTTEKVYAKVTKRKLKMDIINSVNYKQK